MNDDIDDEYCEAEFCRVRIRPGPHPDDVTDEEMEEQWLLDAIAEHEEWQFLLGFAEQEYQKDLAKGLI